MKKSQSRVVTTIEVAEIPDGAEERYIERFLSPHILMSNRKVYIYPEVHAVLSRMVRSLGTKGVSIGSYASEILLDHFANHQSVMQGVFDTNKEPLF